MSKAFTRESDEGIGDGITPFRPGIPPGVKRYVTKEGADRLRHQANKLLEEKHALLTGADVGSADTNSKVRHIEAAIYRIQQILEAVIVAVPPADPSKVAFGSSIRIRDQQGEEETYQVVGPDEAEPGQGRISAISPIAQALMNRRAGDTVRFNSPAGEQKLTILAVYF